MNTTQERLEAPAPRLSRMEVIYVAILALFLSALTVVASGPTLETVSSRMGVDSPFSSPEVQLSVLRVASGVWAVIFSVLQAIVLAVLLGAIARVPRPRLGVSWWWLLVGQLPFLITVVVIQLTAGAQGMAILANVWLRAVFGVVGVLVYAIFAKATLPIQPVRLAIFTGVAVTLNAALLLIGQ